MSRAIVTLFREPTTETGQLVVACPTTKKCAIIDPVLDFDMGKNKVETTSADALINFCKEQEYTIEWAMDTHIHADHISATYYIQQKTGCKTAIGAKVAPVQKHFCEFFGFPASFIEGKFWDHHWHDGDSFTVGDLTVNVIHTPGHTPADLSYYIPDDCLFTGDSIFMPDMGTARCDFPGGDVEQLWESMQKILALPKHVRVFVGHDYCPNGREYSIETTVADQLASNKHVKEGTSKEEFTTFRKERDAQLGLPRLLFPSMQFNIRGGRPPKVDGQENLLIRYPLTCDL